MAPPKRKRNDSEDVYCEIIDDDTNKKTVLNVITPRPPIIPQAVNSSVQQDGAGPGSGDAQPSVDELHIHEPQNSNTGKGLSIFNRMVGGRAPINKFRRRPTKIAFFFGVRNFICSHEHMFT